MTVPEYAVFVPYRHKQSGEREFFLQKRDAHAPTHANQFAFWGGGIEKGELPQEAVDREEEEELCVQTPGKVYVAFLRMPDKVIHLFMAAVPRGYEDAVTVREGEYGKFMTLFDALTNVDMVPREVVLGLRIVDYAMSEHA
jgi:ADP-ribose pyrophosphatase YjhB (NUDIX family)